MSINNISNLAPDLCYGCSACFNICPQKCISMNLYEGFLLPSIDTSKCSKCGICKKICPSLNNVSQQNLHPVVYAAWHKDDAIRKNSSSGGAFSALAAQILSSGGVVVGAAFDKNLALRHKAVHSMEELEDLRGSKYLQSNVGDTYKQAKEFLESSREVLFSGTSCQIAGLYSYLRKKYSNLFTCDIVCHGVPSPYFFDKYIKYLQKLCQSTITKYNFRDKISGWKRYSTAVTFSNNKKYTHMLDEDPYMICFLRNYPLRPSCYVCKYKTLPRTADISLGDFWGVASGRPDLDDDKGTSLLLVNSDKGNSLLEKCKDNLFLSECNLEHAISGNPCIIKPVARPKQRDSFFIDLNSKPFKFIIKKYATQPSRIYRLAGRIKRYCKLLVARKTASYS